MRFVRGGGREEGEREVRVEGRCGDGGSVGDGRGEVRGRVEVGERLRVRGGVES